MTLVRYAGNIRDVAIPHDCYRKLPAHDLQSCTASVWW